MKKRILLFTAVAALGYVTLSSYGGGPAANGETVQVPKCLQLIVPQVVMAPAQELQLRYL